MASDVGMLPDETDATRQLQAMLEQLRRDPRAALGVDARPTAEAVRSQFLVQTKRFHPTKFARMSPGVVRLANEVFIAIRQAHDALVRELGAVPTSIPRASSAPPTSTAAAIPPAASPAAAPGPRAMPQALAAGTYSSRQPIERPGPSAAAAVARAATAADANLAAGTRSDRPAAAPRPAPTVSTARLATPASVPAPTTARLATPISPPGPTAPRGTPSSPPGVARVATPATARTATPTNPPVVARTPTPMAVSPRITGQRPAVRLDGTGPTTGQRPAVAAPAAEFDEDVSLRLAMEFMGRRQWADAKQAFLQLASKVPTNKRYRAMLAVARGRGYQDENRHDDARAEFRRATELDPSLDAARAALEQLGEPEKKSGGLFGRLLKK